MINKIKAENLVSRETLKTLLTFKEHFMSPAEAYTYLIIKTEIEDFMAEPIFKSPQDRMLSLNVRGQSLKALEDYLLLPPEEKIGIEMDEFMFQKWMNVPTTTPLTRTKFILDIANKFSDEEILEDFMDFWINLSKGSMYLEARDLSKIEKDTSWSYVEGFVSKFDLFVLPKMDLLNHALENPTDTEHTKEFILPKDKENYQKTFKSPFNAYLYRMLYLSSGYDHDTWVMMQYDNEKDRSYFIYQKLNNWLHNSIEKANAVSPDTNDFKEDIADYMYQTHKDLRCLFFLGVEIFVDYNIECAEFVEFKFADWLDYMDNNLKDDLYDLNIDGDFFTTKMMTLDKEAASYIWAECERFKSLTWDEFFEWCTLLDEDIPDFYQAPKNPNVGKKNFLTVIK